MKPQVIKNPAGTYSIVGFGIPVALVYSEKDGSPLTDETARKIAQFGPGFVKDAKLIVYQTESDALNAIEAWGK